jgi:tetratricopeptide (TPR) repeat protein
MKILIKLIRHYEIVLEELPKIKQALLTIGNIYKRQGKYDLAIHYYQKLIFIEPDNPINIIIPLEKSIYSSEMKNREKFISTGPGYDIT